MDDIRPGFTIVRCCRNCQFYQYKILKNNLQDHMEGACKLPLITDKDATPLKTHGTAYCDAHIWKSKGNTVQKIAVKFGATPPEGTY